MRRPTLLTQILAVHTVLITAAALAATQAPTVLDHAGAAQLAILGAAVLATVLADALVLRRRLNPLEHVIDTMARVDLSEPGLRVTGAAESVDVERLHAAFNRMLERLEVERTAAAGAVLRAQEAERARLARDLHDEVNQALTGVLLRLQATAHDAPPQLAAELEGTRDAAATAMAQLRALAHELRPVALDELGLASALRTLVEDVGTAAGLHARLRLTGDVDGFRPDEQLVVFRVVQEALSNVVRHAHAHEVDVEVGRDGARGTVRVVDDGRGLDVGAQPGDGMGLAGMRERALQTGGRLALLDVPGGGTCVELLLGASAPRSPDLTQARAA